MDKSGRCDLLLALAETLNPAGESQQTFDRVAPEALALAEAIGDRRRAFQACRLATDALESHGAAAVNIRPGVPALGGAGGPLRGTRERRARVGRPGAGQCLGGPWAGRRRRSLRLRALALARKHDDPETLFRCVWFDPLGGSAASPGTGTAG